jgi:hypothetical protein
MAKRAGKKNAGGGVGAASSHDAGICDEEKVGGGGRQKMRRVGSRRASSGPTLGAKARQDPPPQLTAEELELERIWNLPVQWDVPDIPRAKPEIPLPDKIDRGRFIRPVADDLLCDPTGVMDELGFQVDPETCVAAPGAQYSISLILLRGHLHLLPLAKSDVIAPLESRNCILALGDRCRRRWRGGKRELMCTKKGK